MKTKQVEENRSKFLEVLRSERFVKGTILSDEKGNPVIPEGVTDKGHCCCAIMGEMFGKTVSGRISLPTAMAKLGLTSKDCRYIQQEINDGPTSFIQDADRIENEVFNNKSY